MPTNSAQRPVFYMLRYVCVCVVCALYCNIRIVFLPESHGRTQRTEVSVCVLFEIRDIYFFIFKSSFQLCFCCFGWRIESAQILTIINARRTINNEKKEEEVQQQQ